MAIATLGAAAIAAGGAYFSGSQSARASERGYKNRYQWQVKDLQKAGLNPMLAVSHGAPTPTRPEFPNVGEAAAKAGTAAYSARSTAKVQAAQLGNIQADTELKEAQRALASASALQAQAGAASQYMNLEMQKEDLPYAYGTAREKYYTLAATRRKITNESEQISENIKITEQNYLHLAELQPLLREYQRLVNAVQRAELPAKEAEAMFWDALPEAAWVQQLRKVLPKIGPFGK